MNLRQGGRVLNLIGIIGGTIALIALTWFGTLNATRAQRTQAEARIAASMASQAQIFDEQLQRQLLEVDQTLRIIAQAWAADTKGFNLLAWRDHLVLLRELSPNILIADELGVVRHHTIPEAVGTNVSNTDYFRHYAERIFDDDRPFISPTMLGPVVRQWHMDVARRLRRPDGSFGGVIVAALRVDALSHFYHVANIGTRGLVAVVGLEDGRIRVAESSNPIDPGSNIAGSAMFKAMQAEPDGVWTGRSALDGIERVHGFHRVADRNLGVVVAIDRAEALRPTRTWETAAVIFAAGITALILLMAGILLNSVRVSYRRERALSRDRAVLAAANTQLEVAKRQADAKTAQLEATLAGMSDGVAMVDSHLCLVEWNSRFPEIVGVPSSMLRIGLPMEDILRAQAAAGQFGDVDIEAEVARRMTALRTGSYAEITERMRPDGTVVELRRNKLPDGSFVTLYTDITARKAAENHLREATASAEADTHAMSRFVAIVSHEIRTPLNALLNSLTLLGDSGIAPTQRMLLDMARQSGDALLALINDILEMSRMEAGELTLRPSIFALRPLLESALEMFGGQAAERRIALRLSVANGVPDALYTDPGRLRQVLINLLSNAVKFAQPGEVRLTAETRLASGKTLLRVAVRDRGPVIPPEGRARLFQAFSRLEHAETEGPLGTGLGLAICRHIVTRMEGEIGCDIWTTAAREAGNEFWITVPITTPPSEAKPSLISANNERLLVLPRARILLVEDIPANQLVTATLLRREGHLVDIAASGADAINALEQRPYDLVFMDVFMPGMSGLDTTRRIRSLPGPAATVPIIALTANVCPEDQAICAAAGMDGLLGKPVDLTQLLDALARHVWPYRSERVLTKTDTASAIASPVLSQARLTELQTVLPADTLANLVEDCLRDLAERLVALQQSVRQQSQDDIHAHAHAMAGMAAEYGMAALEARLRVLMQLAQNEPASTPELVSELEAEIFRAGTALRDTLHIEMV